MTQSERSLKDSTKMRSSNRTFFGVFSFLPVVAVIAFSGAERHDAPTNNGITKDMATAFNFCAAEVEGARTVTTASNRDNEQVAIKKGTGTFVYALTKEGVITQVSTAPITAFGYTKAPSIEEIAAGRETLSSLRHCYGGSLMTASR